MNIEICRKCPLWRENIIIENGNAVLLMTCIRSVGAEDNELYHIMDFKDNKYEILRNTARKNGILRLVEYKNAVFSNVVRVIESDYLLMQNFVKNDHVPEGCKFYAEHFVEELNK